MEKLSTEQERVRVTISGSPDWEKGELGRIDIEIDGDIATATILLIDASAQMISMAKKKDGQKEALRCWAMAICEKIGSDRAAELVGELMREMREANAQTMN